MPAPRRNAARFAAHTARTRISAMSIKGSALRNSTATQATQTNAPTTSMISVFAEPQPHTVVSLTATRTSVMPTPISAAATQLMRPGTRTGDSGTNRQAQIAASTMITSGTQKSQCQLRCSTMTAPATIPTPAPTPRIADIRPMLPATFSRGNSSRMIPNASGKIPPPAPCTTRAMISTGSEPASAATSVPTARIDERPDEQVLLAVHVAEPADDRRADGRGEQIAGQDPGDAVLARVEAVLDRRERRHDRGAEERKREACDRKHEQRQVRVQPLGRGIGRHCAPQR